MCLHRHRDLQHQWICTVYSSFGLMRHKNVLWTHTNTHASRWGWSLCTAEDTFAIACDNVLLQSFTVMTKMKTMQPSVSVFIWRVPPVPGVARQMARWLQKQGFGTSPEPCMGELSLPLSLMPQSHFSLLLSVLTAKVCWPGFLSWIVILMQVNHLGFDHLSALFAFSGSLPPPSPLCLYNLPRIINTLYKGHFL